MTHVWSAGQRRKRLGLGAGVALLVVAAVVGTVVLGLLNDTDGPPLSGVAASEPAASSSPAPSVDPYEPTYPIVIRTAAELAAGRTDLYVPRAESARRAPQRYPVVLLATDPGTPPEQYEQFAHDVAAYGLAVLVSAVPPQDLVDDVRTWSAGIAADPSQFLNGLIGPDVVGVVAHGARRVPEDLRSAVAAVVPVTPTPAGASRAGGANTLVVCGSDEPRACADVPAGVHLAVVDGASASSVTDEGVRGPRTSTTIDQRRIPLIAAIARPTGLWLLAQQGDATAQRYFTRSAADTSVP